MNLAEKLRYIIGFAEEEYDEELPIAPSRIYRAENRRIALMRFGTPEDAKQAAELLMQNQVVIFSVEGTPRAVARRLVDFIGGAAFTKDAQIKHIAKNTYLLAPYDVELIGKE